MALSDTAVGRLAMQRIIAASADIEAQLSNSVGTRPIQIMLIMARQEAAVALEMLATAFDAEIIDIRKLQNTVARYHDLIGWFRKIVSDGFDYDQMITQEDRDELIDLLARQPDGEHEATELGLIDEDMD